MRHDDDDLPIQFADEEPLTPFDWVVIALLIAIVGSWFMAELIGWPY